jgi:serine/threonine protein kinase
MRAQIDPDTICPRCLQSCWDGSRCRDDACAFDGDAEQTVNQLPPGVILNERFFVGLILGRPGGFGVTYRSLDLTNGAPVAIKEYFPRELCGRSRSSDTIIPGAGKYGDYYQHGLEQFRREAKLLMQMEHAAVVKVIAFFEANNTAYFVMPFVEGMTLEEYIEGQGGKIDFELAVRMLSPVMDALRYTHRRGLTHRDVSPCNIYITTKPNVVLLDFGAARSRDALRLTRLEKAGFSAPEVTSGGVQGPYSDIYSLAATLYCICVGDEVPTPVARGDGFVLKPPSAQGVKIPKAAEAGLLRALSLRAETRQQSMEEFRAAITTQQTTPPNIGTAKKKDNKNFFDSHRYLILSSLAVALIISIIYISANI